MPRRKSSRSSGQIIPKGADKYLVRVFLGRDAAGKRQYTSETIQGTRKDAEKALTKLQVGAHDQTLVSKTKVTLGAHLEEWLKSRVDLGPKTRADYRHRMEKDVIPFLGKRPLSAITRKTLQDHVQTLQKTRKLSPRTIRYTFVVLGMALEAAVLDNLIARDPSQYVKLPKKEHSEAPVLNPDEMQAFLRKSAEGDVQKHALWMLMLTAGMRPQEALALRWRDVDFTSCTVVIVRAMKATGESLKRTGKPAFAAGEVKTKKGRRTLPVPQETMDALQAHKARQAAEILRAGTRYHGQDQVFATRKRNAGNPLTIGTIRKWWKQGLVDAKLPERTLYTSRHSHITALLVAGVHPKVASERAGHATVQITMDTYSHVIAGLQEQASQKIGDLLFRPTGASGAP